MSAFKPTSEQIQALDLAQDGKTFKISAYAGSGKTSTLKLVGDILSNKRGIYLAFNKSIASEAGSKFKKNITCKTFHSLAFSASPKFITEKLSNQRVMPIDIAKKFALRSVSLPLDKNPAVMELCTQWDLGMIVENCINTFCTSAEPEINIGHVLKSMPQWAYQPACTSLAASMLDACKGYWEQCISEKHNIRISHSVYLKYWSLNNPVITEDFCLFDEAQDADPIMLDLLKKQDCQLIFVGDRHQSIYQWRGAENAMQSLIIPEVKLTKSFRFGPEIAETANLLFRTLLDEKVPLVGNENLPSTVGVVDQPDAYLVRTNSGILSLAIELAEEGRRPQVEIDLSELNKQINDVQKLQECQHDQIEKNSPYFGFESWDEVKNYVEDNKSCDIAPFTKLIQKNGVGKIKFVLSRLCKTDGDCIISTAHKSKGLEFNNVLLHNDYVWEENPTPESPIVDIDESRLIYVAATRAIKNLDYGGMSPLFDKLKEMDKQKKYR